MSTLLSRINKMDEEFKKKRENNDVNNINIENNDVNNINIENSSDSTKQNQSKTKSNKSTKTIKNTKTTTNTKSAKKAQPKQIQTKTQQNTESTTSVASTTFVEPTTSVANKSSTPIITKKNIAKTQTVSLTIQDYIDSIFRLIYYICNNKEGYGLTSTKITFNVLNNQVSSITGIPENYKFPENYRSNTENPAENPQDAIVKDNKTNVSAEINGKTGIFNFAYNDENKLAMREFYKYCKNKLVEEGVDNTLLEGSFAIDLDVLFELFKKQG